MKPFSDKPPSNSELHTTHKPLPLQHITYRQNTTRQKILKIIGFITLSALAYQQFNKSNTSVPPTPQKPPKQSPTPQFNIPIPTPQNLPKGKPAPEPFFKQQIPVYHSQSNPNNRYT